MRSLLLLALAGCWTGSSAPEPATPTNSAPAEQLPPMRFRITLERTACLGSCPVYTVTIHGDGRVEWDGIENVAAMGRLDAKRHVSRAQLERLARMVDSARFFERNDYGDLETGPVCTTSNGVTTCSYSAHFCSDTTHAKLTVLLHGQTHMVDNDHCDPKPGIDELEAEVDRLAGTSELIHR